MVDRKIFDGRNLAVQSGEHNFVAKDRLRTPIRDIIPLQAVSVSRLLDRQIPEPQGMNLQRSLVHPFAILREGQSDQIELASVVGHPLIKYQVMHLFNGYGFKRKLETDYQLETWLANVADDWAAMTPEATPPDELLGYLIGLEEIHKHIPGFVPFRDHLLYYVNALDEPEAIDFYQVPRIKKNIIMPLVYFNIDRKGQVFWHDEVLSDNLNQYLLDVLFKFSGKTTDKRGRDSIILDDFAGQAVLPFLYPELAKDWLPEHNGQVLSIAQKPPQVWEHIQDFNQTPFLKNLIRHIFTRPGNVKNSQKS